ncbi:MAG: uroporphyrinogen-III synthase [Candidatus Thiodiazotropha sp.]
MMPGCDLQGRGVLLTRAAHQVEGLVRLIETHRGRAVVWPALEIRETDDSASARTLLEQPWDLMIFISPNAVTFAVRQRAAALWRTGSVAAVGASTAKVLEQIGRPADWLPVRGYDSEGLLSLPQLAHPEGQRVLIVRGEGGRALLGDTLIDRGARVSYAEVYRRVRPDTPVGPLLSRWGEDIQLVTVTSLEVLHNLVAMLGEPGWVLLSGTPLVVVSERMRAAARTLGFTQVILAKGADEQSLLQAICQWAQGQS